MTRQIFEGIRILDFTVMWSGPYAARILAEMGAEVIHIEHPRLLGITGTSRVGSPGKMAKALGMPDIDPNTAGTAAWRGVRDSYTAAFQAHKKFLALDSTKPEGQEILYKLVKLSDVSIENLTPDVAYKLGVTYPQLKAVNPQIINCAMRSFGAGPWEHYSAFGTTMEFLSGITSLTGYGHEDGDRPMRGGVYTVDPLAAMQGVAAIISALMYRRRTGKGQNIEVRQYEAATSFVNDEVIEYNLNKRVRPPTGNSERDIAFQGCYPADGSDQWVFISIRNQSDWAKLCGIIGKREWLKDNRFNDPSKLEPDRKEVDAAISAWTGQRNKDSIARLLQSVNIPAGPVNETHETVFYPPIRHRQLYKWVEHPYGGIAPIPGMPARFAKTPLPDVYQPTHAVGGDNDYVYRELLKLPESKIKELEEKKIIKP